MTLLALALLSRLALADRPIHEPHPAPGCDQGAVQACVAENRAAQQRASAAAAALDAPIAQLSGELARKAGAREEKKTRLAQAHALIAVLSSEIAFSQAPVPAPAAEILPGFPSLEDFFPLHPLERQWLGKYPSERARLLSERRATLSTKENGLADDYANISTDFDRLNAQYASLSARRSNLVTEVSQHEHMCGGGCREALCPPREP